ncbi:MAG: hypothetical protein ACFE9L_12095 [Candidatus Hodarchaeota archaeon]
MIEKIFQKYKKQVKTIEDGLEITIDLLSQEDDGFNICIEPGFVVEVDGDEVLLTEYWTDSNDGTKHGPHYYYLKKSQIACIRPA